MKDFIRLTDLCPDEIVKIFGIADEMKQGRWKGRLQEKSAVLFFPDSSIRTRLAAMHLANEGAVLNPCPPFYRGEEVTEEVINSKYFVGYEFKENLLWVQQAVMAYCKDL